MKLEPPPVIPGYSIERVDASARAEVAYVPEPSKSSAGPYAMFRPGSVSGDLLELLPLSLRPNRTDNGTFTLDIRTLAKFQARQ